MIAILADENVPPAYLDGIRRRIAGIDIVRIQDIGITGAPDPEVLEYSDNVGRVVLTLDSATFPDHAYDRLLSGLSFPGVIVIRRNCPIRDVLDDLELILSEMAESEIRDTVRRVPL